MLIDRKAHPLVVEALGYSRVVFLQGARQVGKSTLARQVIASDHPAAAITLDDQATRDAAAADPHGFIAGLRGSVLIDEVQLVPDLLYAIKQAVDDDPVPGRFLLTGSVNVLTAPKISESLAGRVHRIELWPLAQSEIHAAAGNFVDRLFAGDPPQVTDAPVGREAFTELVVRGGYPAVYGLAQRQRRAWYRDYVQSIVERDLRDVASAQKLSEMPRLLRQLGEAPRLQEAGQRPAAVRQDRQRLRRAAANRVPRPGGAGMAARPALTRATHPEALPCRHGAAEPAARYRRKAALDGRSGDRLRA